MYKGIVGLRLVVEEITRIGDTVLRPFQLVNDYFFAKKRAKVLIFTIIQINVLPFCTKDENVSTFAVVNDIDFIGIRFRFSLYVS